MATRRAPASPFKDKHVLITGGLGFIGSNLARALAKQGASITIVDSLIPEYGGNLHNIEGIEDRVRVNISDVRDRHSLPIFVKGHDYLFNLAGQTSHMDSMSDPETDLEINARAQLSILEACRIHNPGIRIVFASTRQIYGKPDYLPVDESHALRPVDVNGINKLAGEQYHLLYHRVHGIRSTILRLTNTIGPRMRIRDARQTFVGVWVRRILENKPFEVWEGAQKRDFTYVDDAVSALLLAASNPAAEGAVYNLGGPPPVTLLELAELLATLRKDVTFTVRNFPADRRKIDIGDFYADYRRISQDLGWKPKVSLETALARTLGFYERNFSHYV